MNRILVIQYGNPLCREWHTTFPITGDIATHSINEKDILAGEYGYSAEKLPIPPAVRALAELMAPINGIEELSFRKYSMRIMRGEAFEWEDFNDAVTSSIIQWASKTYNMSADPTDYEIKFRDDTAKYTVDDQDYPDLN